MRPLSAADAISPAVGRTRQLLFRPFVWTTFLKLSVVGLLTEGFSGSFRSTYSGKPGTAGALGMPDGFAWTPGWIALLAAAGVALLVLSLVMLYVITRLRFALFHCLVTGTTEIRPGWRAYRAQAERFFLFSLVVGIVFLAVVAAIAVPFVIGFVHVWQSSQANGQPDPMAILALVLSMIPIIFLLVLAGVATDIAMRDLMLPHIALDDATVGEAWRAARAAFLREKGAFLLFALLRMLLPAAVAMCVMFVLFFPAVILGLMVFAADDMVLTVLFGTVAVLIWIAMALGVGGPLSIAVRNYALLFYGGRYARLGELMMPEPPAAPVLPAF